MATRRDARTKRWYFRTTVKLPDGTRRRISGTPGIPGPYADLRNTKGGAQAAEQRAIASAVTGEIDKPEPPPEPKEVPTVAAFAETFQTSYRPADKPSARSSRNRILKRDIVPHFGEMKLDRIRQSHVNAFVEGVLGDLSRKSINNRLAVLSSLLGFAVDEGVIAKPTKRLSCTIEYVDAKIVAVPAADVDRMLAACESPRTRAAVLLAADAGLRTGEILGLQFGDIKGGMLEVRRAIDRDTNEVITPKHDKVRMVPLSPRLVDALEALPRRGLWAIAKLTGDRLGYYGILDPIKALYALAGVEKPPKPIHCLRHTFGSEAAAAGVPITTIKELMGHARIETTMRYITVNEAQLRDAIATMHDYSGSGSGAAARNEKRRR